MEMTVAWTADVIADVERSLSCTMSTMERMHSLLRRVAATVETMAELPTDTPEGSIDMHASCSTTSLVLAAAWDGLSPAAQAGANLPSSPYNDAETPSELPIASDE